MVVPGTPADAKGLLTSCIDDDDPCVFIEPSMLLYVRRPGAGWVLPRSAGLGQRQAGRHRRHRDQLGVAGSAGAGRGREAGRRRDLRGGCSTCAPWCPLDREAILASVAKTGRAVVVHAATQFAGPGAELAAMIQQSSGDSCRVPSQRLGGAYPRSRTRPSWNGRLFPDAGRIVGLIRAMKLSAAPCRSRRSPSRKPARRSRKERSSSGWSKMAGRS